MQMFLRRSSEWYFTPWNRFLKNKSNSRLFLLLLFPPVSLSFRYTASLPAIPLFSITRTLSAVRLFANPTDIYRSSSPELITLPPHWALLSSNRPLSLVSEFVCMVNITEWVLAWPHQYNMDRGLEIQLQHCSPSSPPAMTYGEEDWLAVCSDDTCLHRMYRK